MERVKALEADVQKAITDGSSMNILLDLLDCALKSERDPAMTHDAIWSLYRIFVTLIERGRIFSAASNDNESQSIVRTWLAQQFARYCDFLVELLQNDHSQLRVCCVAVYC